MVMLPGCTLADGLLRAGEFRRAIAETSMCAEKVRVTCSFGVAGEVGTPAEKLVVMVDQALYKAKRAERNQVQAMSGSTPKGSCAGETT